MIKQENVHLIHFSSAPGGIEVLLTRMVKLFPAYGFLAFIIRPPSKTMTNVYDGTGITTSYGSNSNMVSMLRLYKYARIHKKEIFHVFNIGPFYLLVLRLAGVSKLVYSVRGTVYWKSPFQKIVRKLIWHIAISKKYRIIANSEYSREIFVEKIGSSAERIAVVYNPVYSAQFNKIPVKTIPGRRTIIYAGRLAQGKNLFLWLEIARNILSVFEEAEFKIYGDGPIKNELILYTDKLGIRNHVDFMGFIYDIASGYSNADLMLFLSEQESFGNVVVESFLCGTPVIAIGIPSMREILKNYPQFLIDPDGNISESVIEKIRHIDDLYCLVPSVIKEFRQRFSVEQHIEKLKVLYGSFHS